MFQEEDWDIEVPINNAIFSAKVKNKKSKNECSMRLEMDEILLNAKKTKLNEIYKKEDCEESLFKDDATESESQLSKNTQIKRNNFESLPKNANIPIKSKKSPQKRKNDNNNKDVAGHKIKAKKTKFDDTNMIENDKKLNKKCLRINKVIASSTDSVVIEETDDVIKKKEKNSFLKQKFKKVLEKSNRTPINTTGNKLRERMLDRLKAAQFRYLNEKLYTSSGNEAQKIFQEDPTAFRTYHEGYQQQVKKWPVNPLDVVVKKIQKMPKSFIVADMGCGEAALSKRVNQKVHSFDLVASAPGVVACDMARTPLLKESVDVVVYCLALMGTELTQYLVEANRVLKTGGQLLIAEVESRFDDVNKFSKEVERLGFRLKEMDKQHSVFFFMQFTKVNDPPTKKGKLPVLTLKPCLYKRR